MTKLFHDHRHTWDLYVLKCEHQKYYVGITSKGVEHRYMQHATGDGGAVYTKRHKPLAVDHTRHLGKVSKKEAELAEDQEAVRLRSEYGIFSVSGGHMSITQYQWFMYYDGFQALARLLTQLVQSIWRMLCFKKPRWGEYESISYSSIGYFIGRTVVIGVVLYGVLVVVLV